jgi:hypothetical protein
MNCETRCKGTTHSPPKLRVTDAPKHPSAFRHIRGGLQFRLALRILGRKVDRELCPVG